MLSYSLHGKIENYVITSLHRAFGIRGLFGFVLGVLAKSVAELPIICPKGWLLSYSYIIALWADRLFAFRLTSYR